MAGIKPTSSIGMIQLGASGRSESSFVLIDSLLNEGLHFSTPWEVCKDIFQIGMGAVLGVGAIVETANFVGRIVDLATVAEAKEIPADSTSQEVKPELSIWEKVKNVFVAFVRLLGTVAAFLNWAHFVEWIKLGKAQPIV